MFFFPFNHHLVFTESESVFGAQLYNTSRSAIHQFAAMTRHCLRGGEPDVVRMVEGRVVGISQVRSQMLEIIRNVT